MSQVSSVHNKYRFYIYEDISGSEVIYFLNSTVFSGDKVEW